MSTEATTKDAVEDKANNDGHNEPKSGETSTTASQSNHSNKKENTENDPQTSTSPTQKEHEESNPTSPPKTTNTTKSPGDRQDTPENSSNTYKITPDKTSPSSSKSQICQSKENDPMNTPENHLRRSPRNRSS